MFEDLVNSALSLVKPIIETTKPLLDQVQSKALQNDGGDPTEKSLRDENVLGLHPLAQQDASPFCKGNSQICRFISCSAHNFKSDSNISNLNLVAQLMGDKKMRKAISANPEMVVNVCQEQGLSEPECKIFAKGFSFIDKWVTNMEEEDSVKNTKNEFPKVNGVLNVQPIKQMVTPNSRNVVVIPNRPMVDEDGMDLDTFNDEDYTITNIGERDNTARLGSRNWSSKHEIAPAPRPTLSPIKSITTTQLRVKSVSFGDGLNKGKERAEKMEKTEKTPRAQIPRPIVPINRPRVTRRDLSSKTNQNIKNTANNNVQNIAVNKGKNNVKNNGIHIITTGNPKGIINNKKKRTANNRARGSINVQTPRRVVKDKKKKERIPKKPVVALKKRIVRDIGALEDSLKELSNEVVRVRRDATDYYDEAKGTSKTSNYEDIVGSKNTSKPPTTKSTQQERQNCIQFLG
uniref:INCENP_ARK-bind domain-containing protein n=1 Tax=Rhabditophanes sp. KR3021 TaxID=114890 RepID=A0AC35UI43_9BILA